VPPDEASPLELVPAFEASHRRLVGYLAGVADDLAQLRAQAAQLTSIASEVSSAGSAFRAAGLEAGTTLEAARQLAVPPDLGFARRISEMTESWDHGLLRNRQLAASTAALAAAPYREWLRSMADLTVARYSAIGALTDFGALNAAAGLADLLRSWRQAAEASAGMLGTLARAAYWAALRARDAVVRGEQGPVASFIEEWLGMPPTPERVEAVSAALLEEGWDADAPDDPGFLLADLRKRSKRQARALKPIWETQLNRLYVGSLDQPVPGTSGTLLTIADQLPDPRTAEDLALAREFEQQRLRQVLSRLKPDELQVAWVYAEHGGLTWTEAAHREGFADPAAMGERVRRKARRLGTDHSRRVARAGLA
jgi:hypothetical protein